MLTTQDNTSLIKEVSFMMPERSLYAGKDGKENEICINIPEQLIYRDTITSLFALINLYFASCQIFIDEWQYIA